MNEIKTEMVRRAATNVLYQIDEDAFDAWLASHDQAIRDDATEEFMHEHFPTPQQLIEAALDHAYPVPVGRTIPANTPVLVDNSYGFDYHSHGFTHDMTVRRDAICTFRTLDPLPPLIPDDCMTVWASCDHTPGLGRTIWQRSNDAKTWFALDPADGGWYEKQLSDLINPKPVPEEER
jgi:hypothetical protein